MAEPFATAIRVRYAECDFQGVVFNSHYLAYVDVAITELWRSVVGGYQQMLDRGVDMVVAESRLRFHAPARFDDELRLEVVVAALGRTSIHTRHRICRGPELLVEVEMRHVVVDLTTLRKTPIPDWLRAGLAPWSDPATDS
jgi:acyl-CoA thioester hydrolase